MKIMAFVLTALISLEVFADCRLDYEEDIAHRLTSIQRNNRIGKNSTVATFTVVGGFWTYMGVVLVGPWGVLIGSQFGAIGALPVGTTFWVRNKIKKYGLQKMTNSLSVIVEVEENHPKVNTFSYELLVKNLRRVYPELTTTQFDQWITHLNDSRELCDGTVARFGRKLIGRKKMLADTNDILRYSNVKLKNFLNLL